ncbi:hypothetical protein [Streptomyces sp. NPDC002790]|uniref:hypothetical protein n=1 Tax=Streptomyces sp. NPDC002790 TaxID=3154431 RepID=UPI003330ED9B
MTDIRRAEADGVDKGIALDPKADRQAGREADPLAAPDADRGTGRDTDPMANRTAGRHADAMAPPEAGRDVGREADFAADRDSDPAAGGQVGPGGGARAGGRSGLFPTGERDALEGRLRHALTGFVDEPRAAVEEADHVLEDLTARLTETLAGHRHTLRTSWQGSTEDTERLRIALRDYRETAERLLRL